jgi:short-subunit dehydrogenase
MPRNSPVSSGHALVTGASSGIGAAIAREYAGRGVPLVLTARRGDRLQALAEELRPRVGVEVFPEDLSDPAGARRLVEAIHARGLVVSHLVNNAGYGVPGRYLSRDWEVHAAFLQVMVVSVAELTRRLLPGMEARGFGRVLNVASLAALVPSSAGHTLYAASKAFVIRFSEALAREERARGVHVTALCPGMTWTEFHDVNGMRERVSKLPGWLWLDAASVARLGLDAVERGDARCVAGGANRVLAGLSKYLPERLARALVEGRSRDFRDAD